MLSRQLVRGLVVGSALLAVVFGSRVVSAYPLLQLDVADGVYDLETETIVGTSDPFTLYAILTPYPNATASQINALLARTYYISVALTPQTAQPGGSLGSFIFNGTTVNVTSDMYYGVPPVEANLSFDANDLSRHGIFPTYFSEFAFTFDPSHTARPYNTADNPGGLSSGSGAYYAAFNVDSRLLATGYNLHFDLYDTVVRRGGDIDRDDFAPFSHDAECCVKVPEPTTGLLLGSGLLAFGLLRRKIGRV